MAIGVTVKMQTILKIEAKLKAAILLGFSFLLYWLVDSGTITAYINPRFAGLTKTTAVVMFIMFIVQIFRPTPRVPNSHNHRKSAGVIKWGYIAFIIPLLMGYLLPQSTLDANMAANKRISLNASTVNNNQTGTINPGKDEPKAQTDVNTVNAQENNIQPQGLLRPIANELKQASLINVTDENFNYVMSELYMFNDDYIGKEITMVGFVDKDDSFLPNQFGLARYVITCCAADATLGGLICEYNNTESLKKGSWLTVRGTIQKGLYDQQNVPIVKVTSYKNSEKPQNPYIYP